MWIQNQRSPTCHGIISPHLQQKLLEECYQCCLIPPKARAALAISLWAYEDRTHPKKTPAYVGLKSQLVRLNVGTRVIFISWIPGHTKLVVKILDFMPAFEDTSQPRPGGYKHILYHMMSYVIKYRELLPKRINQSLQPTYSNRIPLMSDGTCTADILRCIPLKR